MSALYLLLCLFICAVHLRGVLTSGAVYITSSTEITTYRLTQLPSVTFDAHTSTSSSSSSSGSSSSTAHSPAHQDAPTNHNTLTVSPDETFQTIIGFGGAITEASLYTLSKMPPRLTEQVLRAYFAPSGNRYTLARVPINSCDFSLGSYNFDESWDDFALDKFDDKLTRDNESGIVRFVQNAVEYSDGRLKLFGSPWSPPAWMKLNGQMTGSSSPCLKADKRYHTAWAKYYVKWLQAYERYGVDFWGITVQNEPEFAAPWEACTYTPAEQAAFVANFLGPIAHDAYPDLKILGYDHNKDHVTKWADELFGNSKSSKHLYGLGVHWYSGDEFDQLAKAHDSHPNKPILATEACHCPNVEFNSWSRAEKYAHDIIGDMNHHVVGWTDWNILLDNAGGPNHLGNMCDSPIIARLDHNPPSLHYQPSYYFLAHFSRFVPPGSKRIKHQMTATSPPSSLQSSSGSSGQHDAGAASFSAPQNADRFSENPNLESVAFLVDPAAVEKATGAPPLPSPHGHTGKHVVMIVLNRSDQQEKLSIQGANDQVAHVDLLPHSIHTFTTEIQFVAD